MRKRLDASSWGAWTARAFVMCDVCVCLRERVFKNESTNEPLLILDFLPTVESLTYRGVASQAASPTTTRLISHRIITQLHIHTALPPLTSCRPSRAPLAVVWRHKKKPHHSHAQPLQTADSDSSSCLNCCCCCLHSHPFVHCGGLLCWMADPLSHHCCSLCVKKRVMVSNRSCQTMICDCVTAHIIISI